MTAAPAAVGDVTPREDLLAGQHPVPQQSILEADLGGLVQRAAHSREVHRLGLAQRSIGA